jgi:L-iditol 2-dehydrogenase
VSEKIPKQMCAVVYHGPNDLRVETLPVPKIGSDELLVKVAVCGVCPTDIKKIQYGTVPPPRVFGHETAGTIVQVGARVRRFRVGQCVALHHHVPCLKCHACRHRSFAQCLGYKRTGITAGYEPAGGGFAEYVRVMPFVFPGIVPIPARNTFLEGAMLEPVNTVLKAVRRLEVLKGDHVLVVGQGPIGLMFTQLLALEGVAVIANDLVGAKLRLARRFGARWVVRGEIGAARAQIDRITKGKGIDAAVIAVPVDSIVGTAQNLVRGGGRILLFAHTRRGAEAPLDLASICMDEKDLLGSYSSDVTIQDEVARLVFSRRMDVRRLVTHEFPLEKAAEAIALAAKPRPDSLKIVLNHFGTESAVARAFSGRQMA